MRHIIVVNDYAHVNGGAAQVAIASAIGLVSRGYSVTCFAGVEPVDPALSSSDVRLETLGMTELLGRSNRVAAAIEGMHSPLAKRRMEQLLATAEPAETIMHVHGWSKAITSSIVPAAVRRGIPVVLTLHDYFAACPNGGFYDYQAQQICTRKPLSIDCCLTNCDKRSYGQKVWRVARQVAQQQNGIPSAVSHFAAVSHFSARIMRPLLPADRPITVVPNPITCQKAPPAMPEENSPFLFVGRLEPEKGGMLFAEAVRQASVRGVIIGTGSEAEHISRTYPEIDLKGWRARDEVLSVMRSARALVFPSAWYETQGMVVLEAAACGVPAIVSDVTAASELIADGETGFLFRSGKAEALAASMRKMLDQTVAGALGSNAYNRFWQSPPTLDRHLDALEALYRQVWEEVAAGVRKEIPRPASTHS